MELQALEGTRKTPAPDVRVEGLVYQPTISMVVSVSAVFGNNVTPALIRLE